MHSSTKTVGDPRKVKLSGSNEMTFHIGQKLIIHKILHYHDNMPLSNMKVLWSLPDDFTFLGGTPVHCAIARLEMEYSPSSHGNSMEGRLVISSTVPGDSGNYSCLPSYATPDWVMVNIVTGQSVGSPSSHGLRGLENKVGSTSLVCCPRFRLESPSILLL